MLISTVKDSDIFKNSLPEPKNYTLRPTAKGIVVDDSGKVAILFVREHGLFPGGGIEAGETKEEAFIRECKEEVGCDVAIDAYIGQFDQYRAQVVKKYEVHFFIAHVVGEKSKPTTTEEGELACILKWKSKDEILEDLESQIVRIPHNEYASQFNCRTHLEAFKKYLEK